MILCVLIRCTKAERLEPFSEMKVPSAENPDLLKVPVFKPGVGLNTSVALCPLPANQNSSV